MNFLKNYFSTLFFIIILYIFYSTQKYYTWFFVWNYGFAFMDFSTNINEIFYFVVKCYAFLLIPFYIFQEEKSKARIVINYIVRKIFKKGNPPAVGIPLNKEELKGDLEKTAILAWIVKWFFAPLMIFWLTGHIFTMCNNIFYTFKNIELFSKDFLLFFNQNFFYMAFSAILFFDVLFFTLWYLIEWSFFKNKIKSVEPTVLWWLVALASYPPINQATNTILWWYSTDFPQFNNFYVHVFLNICILIFMWIYSRASISLWLKASNLTNRWIITSGPYKFVRHPAYFCKNLSWWIWWLPIIILSISSWDIKTLIYAILSLIWWSYIYYLRAKTEENHLSLDEDYIKYKNKVKYMFIPWIK